MSANYACKIDPNESSGRKFTEVDAHERKLIISRVIPVMETVMQLLGDVTELLSLDGRSVHFDMWVGGGSVRGRKSVQYNHIACRTELISLFKNRCLLL